MKAHLRFNVSLRWLQQFPNIDKLMILNDCITNRSGRFACSTKWYQVYIRKFYNDPQFNLVYLNWIGSDKERYLKPSIDHITPKAKGGTNKISNLQFLSWFENRCKNELMQYLIRTYTNQGNTVLDFCMGSGSTGVATQSLRRKFIGIERDEKYYEIAKDRIYATGWGTALNDRQLG